MNKGNPDSRNQEETTTEIYASSFFHFMEDLKKLTLSAQEQCEANQFDNVAWEIKNFFIRSAEGILNISGSNLSDRQKHSIQELVSSVSAIPDSVINMAASNSREEHLRAMSQPCWISIREQARGLVALLEPEIARTHSILWPTE